MQLKSSKIKKLPNGYEVKLRGLNDSKIKNKPKREVDRRVHTKKKLRKNAERKKCNRAKIIEKKSSDQ